MNQLRTMKFNILLMVALILSPLVRAQKPDNPYVTNGNEESVDNWPERVYNLTVDYGMVNVTGKEAKAMTINGGIPGPNLEFNEGEFAIINYIRS